MASIPHGRLEPPEQLVRAVTAWEGERGRAWLAALPQLLREYLDRWELAAERVQHPGGSVSMVVLVRQADGSPAALKAGLSTEESAQEHAALAHWDGRGAVRLLRAAPERGVLLLERLHGDINLRSLPEPKAMLEAAGVVQRLWVPPPEGHHFTSVAEHTDPMVTALRARADQPWAAPLRPLVDEAIEVRTRLLSDPPEPLLLHGDFHHGNVLAADRMPWLAIDPKPVVGDPAYDLAWLVRDRLETLVAMPGAQAATRRRLAMLSDALEVDRGRLRDWALWRAVAAGTWFWSVGHQTDGELLLEFAAWL